MTRLKLFPLTIVVALLVACGSDSEPTADASPDVPPTDTSAEDTSPDTEPEPDTAEDVVEDVDAGADDSGADTAPDADADAQVEPPECEGRERAVGEFCRQHFDRSCFDDSHCREGERCEWREGEDLERPGTCMYQIPETLVCPGAEGCETNDDTLSVGFGARVMTPTGWEVAREGFSDQMGPYGFYERFVGDVTDTRTFCDCGRDMICPPGEAYEGCPSLGEWQGPDEDGSEGDGFMQGAWIAGFSNSRNAVLCPAEWLPPACEGANCCTSQFAHDDVWARASVWESGGVRIALVSIDVVGYFYSERTRAADMLPDEWDIDWLIVAATHTHQAPDTVGQWGPGVNGAPLPTDTGALPRWMEDVREHIVGAVGDAVADLRPADLYAAQIDTGPIGFAVRDTRDPFVFDDRITTLHFVEDGADPTDADNTIGTIVNWHSHPEAMGDSMFISSDYPHYVREYVEQGWDDAYGEAFPAREGVGGTTMFISGTVGGLLNPLHRPVIARDGTEYRTNNYEKAEALGGRLADLVLASLESACEGEEVVGCRAHIDDERMTFAASEQVLDVTNVQFHAGGMGLQIFDRPIVNWRVNDGNIGDVNMPKTVSSVTQVRIGGLVVQTFPGELFSEIVTGLHPGNIVRNPILGDWEDVNCAADHLTRLEPGAEGERFGCFIEARNPNPPDLSLFPDEPPLGARLGGDFQLLVGLGNDHVGYLVPPYDFETDPVVGALAQAPGDHYEEQVSIGDILGEVVDAVDALTELLTAE